MPASSAPDDLAIVVNAAIRTAVDALIARLVDQPVEPQGILSRIEQHLSRLLQQQQAATDLAQFDLPSIVSCVRGIEQRQGEIIDLIAQLGDLATSRHAALEGRIAMLPELVRLLQQRADVQNEIMLRCMDRLDAIDAKLGRFIDGVDQAAEDVIRKLNLDQEEPKG